MNHEVPQRNTKRDRKKGMNSTLFVLITSLMIDKGEAYMQMEKTVAAVPHKSFREFPWRASMETRATPANTEQTIARRPNIRYLNFLGA